MPANRKNPVDAFRQRQKRAGIVRVEVKVAKKDVALLRSVAKALGDPAQHAEIQQFLTSRQTKPPLSFKEFLLAAPLEGLDLTRSRDTGRDIDL